MRYTPFDKRIEELIGPDLGVLRDASEDWYVAYRLELEWDNGRTAQLREFPATVPVTIRW